MSEPEGHSVQVDPGKIALTEPNWGRAFLGFVLSTTAACMLLLLLQGA